MTIATTHPPATDLGYLLHKHPERIQTFPLNQGQAHVFYPEAGLDRCTAALLLEIDPVGLVRRKGGPEGNSFALQQYVNDRPYAASSFLSVAISKVFGTAMQGRSKERPELAQTPLPLEARLAVLPCRGGEPFLRQLFEPLGYRVAAERHRLDANFPDWGDSPYFTVELHGTMRLCDLLTHLYVLIPVLDDDKHYWVGEDEVEKLLRHGESWLAEHPARDAITERYLKHQSGLTRQALAQLAEEDAPDPEEREIRHAAQEEAFEKPIRLNQQRLDAVLQVLREQHATRVLDLGCGEGKLLSLLIKDVRFAEIVGLDVSHRSLQIAAQRLRLDDLRSQDRARIQLIHGSLTYRDARLQGYDAAAVVEVIEHLDVTRLASFEHALFGFAHPMTVVLTTPNREYNAVWDNLSRGRMRHGDHRFEWDRAEFGAWCARVAETHGYQVRTTPIGPEEPNLGSPTQMGVFTR